MTDIPLCVICGSLCQPIGNRIAHNRRYCGIGNRCRNAAFKNKREVKVSQPLPAEPEPSVETLAAIDNLVLGLTVEAFVLGPLPKRIPDFVEATLVGPNQWKLTTK